jgi:hypothetical protein
MRQITRIVIGVIGLAILVGVAVAANLDPLKTPPKNKAWTPSPVIFPEQQLPLRFFHDKHLAEEVECTTCHETAETSIRASDNLLPTGLEGEEVCTTCHDLEEGAKGDPPAACTTCHTDAYKPAFASGAKPHESDKTTNKPMPLVIPSPNLKMNHKIHIAKGIACTTCHGKMTDIQIATRENALPMMGKCLDCHNGVKAPSECKTCHIAHPDGRLVTNLATGVLKPSGHYRNDAHNENYLKTHAQTARGDETYCSTCHADRFCLDCHSGVQRPMKIHPNNWVLMHPMSARRHDPTCSSCHRAQTFCLDCHKRMKVVSQSEFRLKGTGQGYTLNKLSSFHPPGWVGTVAKGSVRGRNHHSFQAQRNIRVCASCHTERTCTTCHSTTMGGTFKGLGISPHGMGFSGSRKCRALKARNMRVCTKCHNRADPLLLQCN